MLEVPPRAALPTTVMANLWFAQHLRDLAGDAVSAIQQKSASGAFNGLHLRVEEDARVFINQVGLASYHMLVYNPANDRLSSLSQHRRAIS